MGRRAIGVPAPLFPAYLPVADGIVSDIPATRRIAGEADGANRLLIAGCDPALSLLAAQAREAGIDVVLANANSARSLEWLRDGKIDIAGTHLNEPAASRAQDSPSSRLRCGKKDSWCGEAIRKRSGAWKISRIRRWNSSIASRDPAAGVYSTP